MKNYLFDTSVIIAGSLKDHPHHTTAFPWVLAVQKKNKIKGYVSAHTIAELYSTFTKIPIQPSLNPKFVASFIKDEILQNYTCIDLSVKDYRTATAMCAELSLKGGTVYDALHYQASLKKNLDGIVTFNEKHSSALNVDRSIKVMNPLSIQPS